MTAKAVRKALEAAVVAWCQSATNGDPCLWPKCVCHTDRYDLDMAAAISAFLRALPTSRTIPVVIAPHSLADIVDAAAKERA
jgi:hypothetical protein